MQWSYYKKQNNTNFPSRSFEKNSKEYACEFKHKSTFLKPYF